MLRLLGGSMLVTYNLYHPLSPPVVLGGYLGRYPRHPATLAGALHPERRLPRRLTDSPIRRLADSLIRCFADSPIRCFVCHPCHLCHLCHQDQDTPSTSFSQMDPLTHLLITRSAVGTDCQVLVAGLAADIPFYLTYPAWLIMQGRLANAFKENEWPEAPRWMQLSHHIFHSLPALLGLTLATCLIKGKWPLWGIAWGLHILVDIPTHSRRNWAPQFLWPLSNVTVDGVSWPTIVISIIHRVFR
jgi:hypothetical protein